MIAQQTGIIEIWRLPIAGRRSEISMYTNADCEEGWWIASTDHQIVWRFGCAPRVGTYRTQSFWRLIYEWECFLGADLMEDQNIDGTLRALLSKSATSFQAVVLESMEERDSELTGRALRRFADTEGVMVVTSHPSGSSAPGETPSGMRTDVRQRVWWRRPKCWRDDMSFESDRHVTSIVCDEDSTIYASWLRTVHTTRKPGPQELVGSLSGMLSLPTIEGRLHSTPLLSGCLAIDGWDLRLLEKRTYCGRPGLLVSAIWTGAGHPPTNWRFISKYRAIIDLERGVLLSLAGIVDDQPAAVISTISIDFDGAIGKEVFVYEFPPGTRTVWSEAPPPAH